MSYPLPTLAAQITSTGVSYPSYSDTLLSLQASFQNIYGSDAYVAEDSQDGQFLAILAQSIYDANQAVEAAYLNMNPDNALGAGLSALVKLNGLLRKVPTNSTVTLLLGGAVGTTILNGQAADINQRVWNLPASVTIGVGGTATVTATAVDPGAITTAPGDVSVIHTPTLGWVSVTNGSSATPGNPVEADPALRARQTVSTSLPAQTVLEGVLAAVKEVPGVVEASAYENDTGSTDALGLPAHSISLVVSGGDSTAVATAINLKKTPGAATFGTTSVTITGVSGLPKVINFYRPTDNDLAMAVTIKALSGYTSTVGDAIKQALSDYIAALPLGAPIYLTRLYLPAQLYGANTTFELTNLLISVKPASPTNADITQAIYNNAVLALADIALTVT